MFYWVAMLSVKMISAAAIKSNAWIDYWSEFLPKKDKLFLIAQCQLNSKWIFFISEPTQTMTIQLKPRSVISTVNWKSIYEYCPQFIVRPLN